MRRIIRFASAITALSLCQAAAGGPGAAKNSPAEERRPKAAIRLKGAPVTPADGTSWLDHLGRAFNETSMGKTYLLGPAPYEEGEPPQWKPSLWGNLATQFMVLSGSDLYRLNCQGCHGANGEGAPPEISSLVDPVRATSPELIAERMKKVGAPISSAIANQLAAQAATSVLQRIAHGGQNMPPFPHLDKVEVQVLVAYLNQLVGVPGAKGKQRYVEEPASKVGEHLVKATCQICHGATGPNPSPQQLLDGAIPPLAVLSTRTTLPEFVRKVTYGAPITMGTPQLRYRGRMPVLNYLSENDVAAAYLYLTLYPPRNVLSGKVLAQPARGVPSR